MYVMVILTYDSFSLRYFCMQHKLCINNGYFSVWMLSCSGTICWGLSQLNFLCSYWSWFCTLVEDLQYDSMFCFLFHSSVCLCFFTTVSFSRLLEFCTNQACGTSSNYYSKLFWVFCIPQLSLCLLPAIGLFFFSDLFNYWKAER